MATPPKGQADYLELGDWNAICSVCGRKYKASTMVKLPKGLGAPWGGDTYVCRRDWRPRQPQDFVKGIPEKMAAPWVQSPVDLSSINAIPLEADEDEADINVCTNGAAPVIITIPDGTYLPVLTINLGTGPAVTVVINAFGGGVGLIETTSSSDACLPGSLTSVTINAPAIFTPELSYTEQPEGQLASLPMNDVVVELLINSSRSTDFTGNVTIAIGSGTGTLSGTLVVAAVAGLATFDDLSIDTAGDFTLIASFDTGHQSGEIESEEFTITAGSVLQETLYNLPAGAFESTGFLLSFYNAVLWAETNVGGAGKQTLVFDFGQSSSPINTIDHAGARFIFGTIYEESLPPGYVTLVSGTNSLYRSPYDGVNPLQSVNVGFNTNNIIAITSDRDNHVWLTHNAPVALWELTNVSWALGTVTATSIGTLGAFTSPTLTQRGGAVPGRAYVYEANTAVTGRLGYVTAGAPYLYTEIKTWVNESNRPLLGGPYDDDADTFIYVESGDNNDANVVQKLEHNGTVSDSCRIAALSATSYAQITQMVYDYVNELLWIQVSTAVYVIAVNAMTLIYSGTLLRSARLIGPVGASNGGVYAVTTPSGTDNRIERIYIG